MADLWREIRHEFPALRRHVYLNAAAASPIPRCVRAATARYLRELERDGDARWDDWLTRRETVREGVAQLVGAAADEIAFAPNTSTGINIAVDLLGDDGPVAASAIEFPALTLPWIHRGVSVRFVEPADGIIAPAAFHVDRTPGTATVVVSHVQFANGCRIDLEALAALKAGRALVVSGSQSVGAFPLDVRRSAIDVLAVAGHKWLCAGYGAGFVFVARHLLARPPRAIGWLSVRDPYAFENRRAAVLATAARYELGCPAFGAIFALGAAVDFLRQIGIDRIAERVLSLNARLTDRLRAAGLTVQSPAGPYLSGQTLVAVADPRAAVGFLAERGVLVTEKRDGVRIATHFYNDEADIDAAVTALRDYRARERAPLPATTAGAS